MNMRPISIASTLLALALHGCSSNETSPTSPPPPEAGVSPIDAGDAGSPAPDATVAEPTCILGENERWGLHGVLRYLDGSASPPALAGARVCAHGRSDLPCTTTDADGKYDHACLPAGEVLVHFSLAGYAPLLWLRTSAAGERHQLDTFLVRDADDQKLFVTANVTYPRAGYGMITVNDKTVADGTKIAAVTANVEGPFYSGDGTSIDPNATGTFGQRVTFFVAPVGDVELTITSVGGNACVQLADAFHGTTPGTVKVPVLEGTESALFVVCPLL
jgi:hypothetical protein